LHLAAGGGHTQFCEQLLAHRAGLHVKDQYGRDAAAWAAGLNKVTSLGFLIDRGLKPSGLYLENSIQHGRYDTTKLLLEKRANLNQPSNSRLGTTPLHAAAAKGHMQIAELLLQSRANTELKDRHGRTAVDIGNTEKKGQRVAKYIETFRRRKSEL